MRKETTCLFQCFTVVLAAVLHTRLKDSLTFQSQLTGVGWRLALTICTLPLACVEIHMQQKQYLDCHLWTLHFRWWASHILYANMYNEAWWVLKIRNSLWRPGFWVETWYGGRRARPFHAGCFSARINSQTFSPFGVSNVGEEVKETERGSGGPSGISMVKDSVKYLLVPLL